MKRIGRFIATFIGTASDAAIGFTPGFLAGLASGSIQVAVLIGLATAAVYLIVRHRRASLLRIGQAHHTPESLIRVEEAKARGHIHGPH